MFVVISKHFFEYAKACIRYDTDIDRFYVWDYPGEWKKEFMDHRYLKPIFNDFLYGKIQQIKTEQSEIINLPDFPRKPYILYEMDKELDLMEKMYSQIGFPRAVLRELKRLIIESKEKNLS